MWEIIYTEISVGIYILELVGGGRPREANGDEHDGNPLKKIVQQYIWGTAPTPEDSFVGTKKTSLDYRL